MRKLVSLIIAVLIVISAGTALPVSAAESDYVMRYELPVSSPDGWQLFSATQISKDMSHGRKRIISFTSTSDKISTTYDFKADKYPIDENSDSLALMFHLYISDASDLITSKSNVDYCFYLSTSETTYQWDISDLSIKSGWNLVTLNLRTSVKIEKNTEFPTESTVISSTDASGQSVDEIVYLKVPYARFGLQAGKSDLKTKIAFDDLRIVTLILHEDPTNIHPIKDSFNTTSIILALVIAAAIIIVVIISSSAYAKKELRRRQQLRRKKRREMKRYEDNDETANPNVTDTDDNGNHV